MAAHRAAKLASMKEAPASTFEKRLGRFVRWFFSASPEAVIESRPLASPRPHSRAVRHRERPPLVARHSGPVRVAVKAKR
jgi:hypothetical protein